jgi:acetyltransferase
MAFIAVRRDAGGDEQTLGVVRASTDPDNIEAEFAIVVRSDLKGRGLGHLLLDKMIRYLRGRGTGRVVGFVLHENLAMRDLAVSNGFVVDRAGSDADAFRLVLSLSDSGPAA